MDHTRFAGDRRIVARGRHVTLTIRKTALPAMSDSSRFERALPRHRGSRSKLTDLSSAEGFFQRHAINLGAFSGQPSI